MTDNITRLKEALEAYKLDDMAEAFHRVIEAQAERSPFHQPINADAMLAIREFRGLIALVAQVPAFLDRLGQETAARRQAQEENAELKARLASQRVELMRELRGPMVQVEKDARRYRALRSIELQMSKDFEFRAGLCVDLWGDDGCGVQVSGDALDAAVDAAIASQEVGRDA